MAFLIAKLRDYRKQNKRCFVFVPTIGDSEILFSLVRFLAPGGNYVSSQKVDRAEIIEDFKKGRYRYLITTAVLERGITVKNLQVIVYGADSPIYDAASLIQIAGRAGRKADAPKGDVFFVADKASEAMERAIKEIRYCNTFL